MRTGGLNSCDCGDHVACVHVQYQLVCTLGRLAIQLGRPLALATWKHHCYAVISANTHLPVCLSTYDQLLVSQPVVSIPRDIT